MLVRPTISVFNSANAQEVTSKVTLPAVCTAPIRLDIVQFVHDQISKNTRQAHGVSVTAGMQHSAISWGPGRAVARVPRISGSGTSRAAQGAFANSCRKGRFIIWTESAFKSLDKIFGSYRFAGQEKSGYHLHRTVLTNPDIAKIINSDAVQSVVRAQRQNKVLHSIQKKNPLRNHAAKDALNPHAATLRRMEQQANQNNKTKRELALKNKRGISAGRSAEERKESKTRRNASRAFMAGVQKNLNDAHIRDAEEQQ